MHRPIRSALVLLLTLGLAGDAFAQVTPPVPRPVKKGRKVTVKIDTSPQQAAIYLDDKQYGIVGYTPYSGTLVSGDYKLILDLQGFKTDERVIRVDSSSKTFFVVMEKQILPGIVDVQAASDPNVTGANVFVDGELKGTAPVPVEVKEGRHLVEIKKKDFADFAQWVTISQGQRVTLAPALKAAANKGSLLVDADVADAEVIVDGVKQKDTSPVLVDDLDEGPHTVEVRKPPSPAWKQTIAVKGGQRTKVQAVLAGNGGSLRVIASVPEAEVWLDGALKGKTPVSLDAVAVGGHIIEVKAPGFATNQQQVTIEPGQSAIIKVDLVPAAPTGGHIRVVSPVPGAEVYVDGASVGNVPYEKVLTPGEHYITVAQQGYAKYEAKLNVEAGKDYTVTAELRASGGLKFLANVDGADVIIDGEPVGKTPLERPDVTAGQHLVVFRMPGYVDFQQQVNVQGGQQAIVSGELRRVGASAEEIRGLSSFGAKTIPPGRFTVDAGTGYPWWVEVRANVGVEDNKLFGLDVGVGIRSYLTNWDLIATTRLRFYHRDPFALGLFAQVAGGGGASGRNQFSVDGGFLTSITFNNLVTVTGRLFFDLWTDRLCAEPEMGMTVSDSGPDICTGKDTDPADLKKAQSLTGNANLYDRDGGARVYLSVAAEASVAQNFGLYLVIEGAPFQDERAAHSSLFNSTLLGKDDPIYNLKAGLTFRF